MLEIVCLAWFALAGVESEPVWIEPRAARALAAEPHWIWARGADGSLPTIVRAPAGSRWFSKTIELAGARDAALAVAADQRATVFVNGAKVLEVPEHGAPVFAAVELVAGANQISIEAAHAAVADGTRAAATTDAELGPGGLIAQLELDADSGACIVTDSSWRASSSKWASFPSAPAANEPLTSAVDLGSSTVAPWKLAASALRAEPACPIMRRSFRLADAEFPLARATVRVIGLGHYELRCNGRVVGDSLVNQAWSEYDHTLYSQEFDLAPYLARGENVLALALGNSFWRVRPANDAQRFTKTDAMPDFSKGRPYLVWLDASIAAAHGELKIRSDAEWKWTDGPLIYSNVYAGEDFDARREPAGWDRAGFDDRSWRTAVVAPAPEGRATPLDGPPIRAFEVFEPTQVLAPAPGVFTYVFPQNCSALLRVQLSGGSAGSRVRFKPCEYVDPSGRVRFTYTWGTGKDIWFDYKKRGDGVETHQTLFCYVGAQFVGVEGAVPKGAPNPEHKPVVESLELVHTRAACREVGWFSSSSPLHDGADRLIDWSIRSNMSWCPTDCPHREKNSWLEQDWHMARALSYRFDIRAWFTKLCRDVRDTQLQDGHVPTNSPNYLVGIPPHGFWNEAPEWGISSVLVPWHVYEWYGDRSILEASFESAKRYVDYLGTQAKDGAISSNLGDWYDYGHGKGNGESQWTPSEVSATALWAAGAETVARMAVVLSRADDRARYSALRERIGRDFLRRFYDAKAHLVANHGSCQAGNTTAIALGLIPAEERAPALERVVEDLEHRGYQQTSGEVLQVFLVRALAENGRGDVLHRVYDRTAVGSYGFMVASGLTTLPESWDAHRGTGDSLNHFMLGHLLEWHFAYVAGLRQKPGSMGWTDVLIAPQPPPADLLAGDTHHAMRSARARFASPAGEFASEWKLSDETFAIDVDVPVGAHAELVLPDGSRRELSSGRTRAACAYPAHVQAK